MRILTTTHFFETHGGGIERVAGHLCRNLEKMGHCVDWAASDEDPAPQDIACVKLRCVNLVERFSGLPMPIPSIGALRRLRDAVARADAVIIHDALYATSIAALVLARRAGKPLLLIQHVADIPFSSRILRATMRLANRLVTRPMLRAADQVMFISATTRDAFADVKTKRPPLVVFNGVDTGVFKLDPCEDSAATRRRHGLSADRRLVLFVGRFVEKKGLAVIEALARAQPDLAIALAGRGPIDPRRWRLPNVTVLAGLHGASLAALYRAADLLLLPSVGEGYPLVVQEAMACGLPVICGDDTSRADPDASRWLTGVKITLSRPAETAEQVAAAIDGYEADAQADAEMAGYAAQTYSWTRMAASVERTLAASR